MKQKISVVLARTNWDGNTNSWQEHKIVKIEVDNPEHGLHPEATWHVTGELVQEGEQE